MPAQDLDLQLITEPCSGCWGQGRIYERNDDGTHNIYTCNWCLGMATVSKTVSQLLSIHDPDPEDDDQ